MPLNTQVVVPAQVKLPGSSLSADAVRALVTGTPGLDKPIVDDGASGLKWGTTTSLPQGLGTTDSPQFAGVNLGHATDTTLSRASAGQLAVEGVQVATASNTLTLTNKSIDAGQLTGTVAAARLPGVLADVDTQGELLAAAGAAASGHTHALDDLSDVAITTPSSGQVVRYNGTSFVNAAIAAGDLPTGISTAKLADGTVGDTDLQCIKDLATTGGAGHFLKQNSVGGPITSEVPSGGFTPKYARYARNGSDQTNISGSFVLDYFQYNNEDVDADAIGSFSGDDLTLAAAGWYIVTQHLYQLSGAYCSLTVNGTHEDRPLLFTGDYSRFVWLIQTTAANQIVKFTVVSSAAVSLKYTDTSRDNRVNFVEILRIA